MGIRIGGLELHWKPLREALKGILRSVGVKVFEQAVEEITDQVLDLEYHYEWKGESRSIKISPEFRRYCDDLASMKSGRGIRLDKSERVADGIAFLFVMAMDDAAEQKASLDLDKYIGFAEVFPELKESKFIKQLKVLRDRLAKTNPSDTEEDLPDGI
jgi:hypothetical protein